MIITELRSEGIKIGENLVVAGVDIIFCLPQTFQNIVFHKNCKITFLITWLWVCLKLRSLSQLDRRLSNFSWLRSKWPKYLCTNLWPDWLVVKLSQILSQMIILSFHVKFSFYNHYSKFWTGVAAKNPHFDRIFLPKKDLII